MLSPHILSGGSEEGGEEEHEGGKHEGGEHEGHEHEGHGHGEDAEHETPGSVPHSVAHIPGTVDPLPNLRPIYGIEPIRPAGAFGATHAPLREHLLPEVPQRPSSSFDPHSADAPPAPPAFSGGHLQDGRTGGRARDSPPSPQPPAWKEAAVETLLPVPIPMRDNM